MTLQSHHVNNVIRTYSNFFRLGKVSQLERALSTPVKETKEVEEVDIPEDKVTISDQAREMQEVDES